ncbi:hypothetical protein CLF_103616, partial [Clonorchis sinensis]
MPIELRKRRNQPKFGFAGYSLIRSKDLTSYIEVFKRAKISRNDCASLYNHLSRIYQVKRITVNRIPTAKGRIELELDDVGNSAIATVSERDYKRVLVVKVRSIFLHRARIEPLQEVAELRILIRTVLDPAQIKDAERIGALYSLLHSALCTQKYFDAFLIGPEILAEDVSNPRPKSRGENENIPHEDDRVQQYATEMRLYVQVEGDSISTPSGDICREAIDLLRTDLEARLTTTMAGNGRQVNVVYQTVLNYDHRKLVKFLVYHVSITPTVEIAFPEKWK